MPVLTVIAGPNGSGKSTLIEMLLQRGVRLGEYLNADDIARELDGPPDEVSLRAQQIVRDRREAALKERRDHAFETVMSHPSHIEYMKKAASAEFEVRLYFVATEDPVINIDRVANRVTHGGHDVPNHRIVDRYHRCLGNLPDAIRAADGCEVFDNSSVDDPMRLVAHIYPSRDRRKRTVKKLLHRHWKHEHSQPSVLRIERAAPASIPVWWFEILLQIKPVNPFSDGPLS